MKRVFTEQELAEVGHNLASLAARFAAKEAVSKALGTGIGLINWREIEVLRGEAASRSSICMAKLPAGQILWDYQPGPSA